MEILSTDAVEIFRSRYSHLAFIKHCWQKQDEPYVVGRHTRTICHLIDTAIEDLKHGKSTYLVIKVHPRAGKSEILSQNLTAHFIGEFPDKDAMICCYNSALALKNSKLARGIIESEKYQKLYPDSVIDGGVQQWMIEGHKGIVTASGLISGITGNGYSLGMLDDYIAGRDNAESQVIRDKIWDEFTNSFLTRRAPVSITIVLATQWHVDDIIGRIEKKLDPQSDDYDKHFPKFRIVSFPAMNGEGDVWVEKNGNEKAHWEHQKWDFLFPERFTYEFYHQQRAALGDYSFSALYQCTPQTRGGNLFVTDKIQWHDSLEDFPKTKYYRVWDLAHTAKQTQKDDPDWTSGTLLTYTKIDGVWHLWVKNVSRMRGKSPERDNYIRAVTDNDGTSVTIAVENSLDSKDSISSMQNILHGRYIVKPLNIGIDKVARAGYIEPIFDAGHVHILRGSWNLDWLNEIKEFPSGKHDDQVDNITAGYFLCCQQTSRLSVGKALGV